MSLSIENLAVESFATSALAQPSVGGDTAYPICIVYVSDCVSCFPEMDAPQV